MQHDTTTQSMIQQHTTRWSNGTNFFFTTNVVRCCIESWDHLTGALLSHTREVHIISLQQIRLALLNSELNSLTQNLVRKFLPVTLPNFTQGILVGSKTTYESNNDSQQVTTGHSKSKLSHNKSKRFTTSQKRFAMTHNESQLLTMSYNYSQ